MDFYEIMLQQKLAGGGGGGDVSVESLSVTENGTYSASSGYAYSPVNVSVPTGVFPSGTSSITSNGIYDVTNFESADVNVPIPSGYIQPTGTSNIVSNGTYDITNFASASVNVPGIVPSGTSSITDNGIYDITNFASVDVNVSSGGGDHDVEDGIITRNISGAYTNSRVTNIENYIFTSCTSLTSVNFLNVKRIGGSAFQSCTGLTEAIFPNASKIDARAFYKCINLMSVYLLGSSVASLTQGNEFDSTPIKLSSYTGSFGSIYVPASLVDSYKVANLWSSIADRITSYVE